MSTRSSNHVIIAGSVYRLADRGSCPVRSKMYGGIPGGGGFRSATEWEIGAQRAAEAAHCILGSLGKMHSPDKSGTKRWDTVLGIEREHIEEELGIIEMVMREYSRDIYHERLHDGYYEEEDVARTVESVRRAAPELRDTANERLNEWRSETDVPEPIHQVGMRTYTFLVVLAESMLRATQNYPEGNITNPYRDWRLTTTVTLLAKEIGEMYSGEKWKLPEPEPPKRSPSWRQTTPLTEEEKKLLEQQPDEDDVDYAMRLLSDPGRPGRTT